VVLRSIQSPMPACSKFTKKVRKLQKVSASKLETKDTRKTRKALNAIQDAFTGSDVDNKKYSLDCIDYLVVTNGKLPDGKEAHPAMVELAKRRSNRARLNEAARRLILKYRNQCLDLRTTMAEFNKTVYEINRLACDRLRDDKEIALLVQAESRKLMLPMYRELSFAHAPLPTGSELNGFAHHFA